MGKVGRRSLERKVECKVKCKDKWTLESSWRGSAEGFAGPLTRFVLLLAVTFRTLLKSFMMKGVNAAESGNRTTRVRNHAWPESGNMRR